MSDHNEKKADNTSLSSQEVGDIGYIQEAIITDKGGHQYHAEPVEGIFPLHGTRTFDDQLSPEEEEIVASHLNDRTIEEDLKIIEKALIEHEDDIAVPAGKMDLLQELLKGPQSRNEDEWAHEVKFQAFLIRDWSLYPEVRAVTRPYEEKDIINPETLRVYMLGVGYAMAGGCLNTFFLNRFPNINISSLALQIFISGTGHMWARLPFKSIPIGFGKRLTINPGAWTYQEQLLAQLTLSVANGYPYAYYAITAQQNENFYGFAPAGIGYIAMLTLSSQFMGFGVAGLMRAFLVYPERCVWYTILPNMALCRSLAETEQRVTLNGWRLLRWEAFSIFAVFIFCWYWVTNVGFQALSYFDWMAWIAPQNVRLQALTGMLTGLALSPISTFDWNNINQGGMISPFWATSTQMLGMMFSLFAILIIWFTNVRFTSYLPINTNTLFANDGTPFSVRSLLTNGKLDEDKYQSYSLPFYSAGNLVVYGSFFMVYPAMASYALLNYYTHIKNATIHFYKNIMSPGRSLTRQDDRFTRRQRKYKEVPEWWFLIILLGSLGMAIGTVEHYKFTETPVWTIFFGVALAVIFTIPFGILYSTANMSLDINVLFELIIGYAVPGNGNALMVSKVYATNFLSQTDNYITNQKQAHYANIAPRSLFRCQMVSMICTSWVQIGLMYWQINGGIRDMCSSKNEQKFTCQNSRTFFNAGVLWGTIGPKRVFGGLYPTMKYCFLIGACIPFVFFGFRKFVGPFIKSRKGTNKFWDMADKVRAFIAFFDYNEVLLISGGLRWAPYNLGYYVQDWYVSLAFQYVIKKKYHAWWKKYTYIIYSGLEVGTAYGALLAFFATGYKHVVNPNWWGNNVPFNTGDADGTAALKSVPAVGYFGPAPGTYP